MIIEPFFPKSYFTTRSKFKKLFIVLRSYLKRFFLLLNILILKDKYKLLLLEYELFPYFPAWVEYMLNKRGIKYIVDYDDAIFHKYDMHDNKVIKGFLKNKIAKVMTYADTVIVCNPYLEAYAKKVNESTFTLPTVVQLDKYVEKMKQHQKNSENGFVIGWIGSWTTGVYVLDILPSMKKFVKKYDNVRFHLVGFDEKLLSGKDRADAHIDVIAWKEEQEIQNILDFDVGMMPLSDDAWSRGKCGFKLVQYMSCKKPVIASAVGMNCTLVEDGVNGILVTSEVSWFEAFEILYLDEVLRNHMSKNNFQKIEQHFNIKMYCTRYISYIKNV